MQRVQDTPAYKRDQSYRRKYGISYKQFVDMRKAQGDRCAICGGRVPRVSLWVLDHCHETGLVRGVLCRPCNSLLGAAADDPDILDAAAKYIRESDAYKVRHQRTEKRGEA